MENLQTTWCHDYSIYPPDRLTVWRTIEDMTLPDTLRCARQQRSKPPSKVSTSAENFPVFLQTWVSPKVRVKSLLVQITQILAGPHIQTKSVVESPRGWRGPRGPWTSPCYWHAALDRPELQLHSHLGGWDKVLQKTAHAITRIPPGSLSSKTEGRARREEDGALLAAPGHCTTREL